MPCEQVCDRSASEGTRRWKQLQESRRCECSFETFGRREPPKLNQTGKDSRIIVTICERVNEVCLNSSEFHDASKLCFVLVLQKM